MADESVVPEKETKERKLKYSRVVRRVWSDEKFLRLSSAKPNAQTLWIRLLTAPESTAIPGLIHIGEAALAEALNWSRRGLSNSILELKREQMIEFDFKSRLIWIPNAIKHNPPESPNVVKGWGYAWKELPDCELRNRAFTEVLSYLEALAYALAWREAFEQASGRLAGSFQKPSPKSSPYHTPAPTPAPTQKSLKTKVSAAKKPPTLESVKNSKSEQKPKTKRFDAIDWILAGIWCEELAQAVNTDKAEATVVDATISRKLRRDFGKNIAAAELSDWFRALIRSYFSAKPTDKQLGNGWNLYKLEGWVKNGKPTELFSDGRRTSAPGLQQAGPEGSLRKLLEEDAI